jgi:hypothetical protein
MSTITRDDLAAYFASVGWSDLDVNADCGKCPNCYHDAAYRPINGDGEITVDCGNCSAPIAEFVLTRLEAKPDPQTDTNAIRATDASWLEGTPVDPLAEPPEPLPAVPGIPFAYHPASVLITGPTGSGRSALIEALLYDAVRSGGLRAAYLSGEVTQGEANARAGDLADRRGDPLDDALRGELANLRYLDLASTIERAWQDPQTWADEMQRLYAIVAIDPLSSVASTLGLDFDKSNSDYVDYFDRLVKPLTDRGVLVPQVDNIGHAIEAKARTKGASAKQDKADVVLACSLRAGPALAIKATKVRSVRAPFRRGDCWTFDRDTQRITRDSEHAGGDVAATFRPTNLMEKVSRAVEAEPGLTRRALRTAVKGSRHDAKELALELLIAEHYIAQRENGKWPTHHSTWPFREQDDTGPQVAPDWPRGQMWRLAPLAPRLIGARGQGPPRTGPAHRPRPRRSRPRRAAARGPRRPQRSRMTRRCPTCRRPLLWVSGALRCCNGQCPGDSQSRLLQEEPGGIRAARGECHAGIPAAPDYSVRTRGFDGSQASRRTRMTDLLHEYRKHRDQGHTHWAACIALARRFDLDKDTVNRVIARAERDEQQPPKGTGHGQEALNRQPARPESRPLRLPQGPRPPAQTTHHSKQVDRRPAAEQARNKQALTPGGRANFSRRPAASPATWPFPSPLPIGLVEKGSRRG